MNKSIVECHGVVKQYGPVFAVKDVSFALMPGEVLSILGPSGCGKTTILRLIAGFESPDFGEISVAGGLVSGPSLHVPPERRNVGMVFQDYALFPHKTVIENISFGLQGLGEFDREKRLTEMIGLVRLDGLEDRYPHELSGGQQQRVALARSIGPRPNAILLDEPFSNLDTEMRRKMRQEVEEIIRQNRIAAVFVTHDREEAFGIADRVAVMRNGHLEQIGVPRVVYDRPVNPFVAEMVGSSDFLVGEVNGNFAITEIGRMPVTSNSAVFRDGDRVVLLIRPDDFQVIPCEKGELTVRGREFRGEETILDLVTKSGLSLKCRQPSYSTLMPGVNVSLVPHTGKSFLAFDDTSSL